MAPRLAPGHAVISFEATDEQQQVKRKLEDPVWDQDKKDLLEKKLKQYRVIAVRDTNAILPGDPPPEVYRHSDQQEFKSHSAGTHPAFPENPA